VYVATYDSGVEEREMGGSQAARIGKMMEN
jgi:hypothetical protein